MILGWAILGCVIDDILFVAFCYEVMYDDTEMLERESTTTGVGGEADICEKRGTTWY
jgi:hypothetical protein